MARHASAAVTLILCAACGGSTGNAEPSRDSAEAAINANGSNGLQHTFRLESEPSVVIGGDDSNAQAQLHRAASAVRLTDGRIAIGNAGTGQIMVLDTTGKHVVTVGRQGRGPGEFGTPLVRVLPTNVAGILAEQLGPRAKPVRFDANGDFVDEVARSVGMAGARSDFATSTDGSSFYLVADLPQGPFAEAGVTRQPAFLVRSPTMARVRTRLHSIREPNPSMPTSARARCSAAE